MSIVEEWKKTADYSTKEGKRIKKLLDFFDKKIEQQKIKNSPSSQRLINLFEKEKEKVITNASELEAHMEEVKKNWANKYRL